MTKDIEELFEDKADEAGFCLDKKWGDYKNPYLDSNTSLAFDFFRSGFLTAENFEKQKLEGCVVVPVQCPDPDFADMLFDELRKNAIGTFGDDMLIHFSNIDEGKIWALMIEAARGGK